jgi:hypothetical protein
MEFPTKEAQDKIDEAKKEIYWLRSDIEVIVCSKYSPAIKDKILNALHECISLLNATIVEYEKK